MESCVFAPFPNKASCIRARNPSQLPERLLPNRNKYEARHTLPIPMSNFRAHDHASTLASTLPLGFLMILCPRERRLSSNASCHPLMPAPCSCSSIPFSCLCGDSLLPCLSFSSPAVVRCSNVTTYVSVRLSVRVAGDTWHLSRATWHVRVAAFGRRSFVRCRSFVVQSQFSRWHVVCNW